jgi:mannose-6-phosphate isomerase-like protein (cupin superfamily)
MSLKPGEDIGEETHPEIDQFFRFEELKMYTIYGPPNHKDGIINATKKDSEKNDVKFDGKTTE